MTSPKVQELLHSRHRIKDWPEEERPREKLLKHGPETLSDAELLAIVIGSGTGKTTALDLAKKLLIDHRSLRGLARTSPSDLRKLRGIGQARSVELVAAFELARRLQAERDERRLTLRGPEEVATLFVPKLRDLKREVFYVVLLNSANGLLKEVKISEGHLNASVVHPREVFKAAIDELAASVILVHNHPSGNPEPSPEDISITKRLVEAGKVMSIEVLDHIVVAGNGFVSLAERGFI
ncbi:MAG: DNA repair protein RadC [Bacteroidota bacterium]